MQVKCLAEQILSALEKQDDGSQRVKTEDECIKVWGDAAECVCLRQNFARNTRKGASFKRPRYVPPKGMDTGLDGVTRRLIYDIGEYSFNVMGANKKCRYKGSTGICG